MSAAAYRAQVVKVCGRVNAAERARRRDATSLARKLKAARTTRAQRDAILVATRATISRGGSNLAALKSLAPPQSSRGLHADTVDVWDRSLDRSRAFAVRLDEASDRKALLGAIAPLTQARAASQEDAVDLVAGLQRLGGPQCEIIRFSERPVPLPPLRRRHRPGPDVSAPVREAPTPAQATATPAPDTAPPVVANPTPQSGPDVTPPTAGGGGDG
jgi:hypothetical protein